MKASTTYTDPDAALRALADRLAVASETAATVDPIGRVLAVPIRADRPSPAADVSAMDGYVTRMADLKPDQWIPISGESKPGAAPPTMTGGQVVRIFTGAIVPVAGEAIVKREETEESSTAIRFCSSAIESTVPGSHIRRCGENAALGAIVLEPGIEITSATVAALANFGSVAPECFRQIRVALLTTGDEVLDPATAALQPWQLRNSNQAAIAAMLRRQAHVELKQIEHLQDDRDQVTASISAALRCNDAVVLTGGVSKGDYDYVPEVIEQLGGQILFHGLPIRPGKPILGAATAEGKLLLGLPGNPVSATINAHRFLLPLLRHIAGVANWMAPPSWVTLTQPPAHAIPLHTMLLVRDTASGQAEILPAMGSGDLVALANSDGYVCVPPLQTSCGPWPMFRW